MPPRRFRSRDVALVAVPALALSFTACGGSDTAYCVDKNDQIVENQYCDHEATMGGSGFFWLYGASLASGNRYAPGTKLKGGDRVAASNVAENARRGGFGSSGSKSRASGVGRVATSHSGGG